MNRGLEIFTCEYVGIVEPDDFADLKSNDLHNFGLKIRVDIVKSKFYYY